MYFARTQPQAQPQVQLKEAGAEEGPDLLMSLYGSHNEAAIRGLHKAADVIEGQYGEPGLTAFEQYLGQVPAGEIFDTETDPEKTASELEPDQLEKLNELHEAGRVMAQAFMQEVDRHEKIADYVCEGVLEGFNAAIQQS